MLVVAVIFFTAALVSANKVHASSSINLNNEKKINQTSTKTIFGLDLLLESKPIIPSVPGLEQLEENKKSKKIKHKVVKGDSLNKIAKTYKTTWLRLWSKNKNLKHPDRLKVGAILVIPDAKEKLKKRDVPKTVQKRSIQAENGSGDGLTVINPSYFPSSYRGFDKGWCTYFAQLSRPDKFFRGNAAEWIRFSNGVVPKVGAVAVNTYTAGGLGHVAIVIDIKGTQVKVRHMNWAGFDVVSEDWTDASLWQGYIY